METIMKLQEIFREVFDDESIKLKRETTAKDIEEWDSLMNMQLIMAAEADFRIKFTINEVSNMKHVGDFVDCIDKKIN